MIKIEHWYKKKMFENINETKYCYKIIKLKRNFLKVMFYPVF